MTKVDKKLKIGLIVPLIREEKTEEILVEYMGFGYLAAVLRQAGYHVDILDAYVENYSIDQLSTLLLAGQYDLMGFTLMSLGYFAYLQEILKRMKESKPDFKNNTSIVVGGYFASFQQAELLQQEELIDYLIHGEGEEPLLRLAEFLNGIGGELETIPNLIYFQEGQILKTPSKQLMQDLDRLPLPARDTLPQVLAAGGKAQVSTSRGCYGRCAYCAVHSFYSAYDGKIWRPRDPQLVVDEIEELVNHYGVREINLLDEEFIGTGRKGQERALAIAEEIIRRGIQVELYALTRVNNIKYGLLRRLQEAGLNKIFLGIEFGSQRPLDFYQKQTTVEQNRVALTILRELGIKVYAGFIMFEPLLTLAEFKENLRFYRDYIPGFKVETLYSRLLVYPNTAVYQNLQGLIQIQPTPRFHPVVGSYYPYQYRDPKVFILYQAVRDLVEPFQEQAFKAQIRELPSEEKGEYLQQLKQALCGQIELIADYLEEHSISEAAEQLYGYVETLRDEVFQGFSRQKGNVR